MVKGNNKLLFQMDYQVLMLYVIRTVYKVGEFISIFNIYIYTDIYLR